MFHGVVSLLDALYIALSSMLVVFTVLLVLYFVTRLFPVIFRADAGAEAGQAAQPEEDEGELLAVVMSAIQAYQGQRRVNPQVRNEPRRVVAPLVAENPMARDCRHKKSQDGG